MVDVDVLEEIRGLRLDFKDLAEKVGKSATRDDLAGYVTREAFDAHVTSHASGMDTRRWWANYGLAVAALVFSPLIYLALSHLTLAVR